MSFIRDLLPEFEQEMKATRRVLERVPTEQGEWKPHAKSFSLGHLAQLVAIMPGWLLTMLRAPDLDLTAGPGYSYESTETLLTQFDKLVGDARAAIAEARDEQMTEPWSLRMGEQVLFTQPRQRVMREHMNHMVHHRAQLGVYLRLLDVPVPSMYGPTADEKWGA